MSDYAIQTQLSLTQAREALDVGNTDAAATHLASIISNASTEDVNRLVTEITEAARNF